MSELDSCVAWQDQMEGRSVSSRTFFFWQMRDSLDGLSISFLRGNWQLWSGYQGNEEKEDVQEKRGWKVYERPWKQDI